MLGRTRNFLQLRQFDTSKLTAFYSIFDPSSVGKTNPKMYKLVVSEEEAIPKAEEITIHNFSDKANRASYLLREGEVIGIPTDTVYGLAADAQNNAAVAQLYRLKGRNFNNPVAICVNDINQVSEWAICTVSDEVLKDLLPGPVTLVFERSNKLNPRLNRDCKKVGIRIPKHAFVRRMANNFLGPIALTSANLSGCPSSVRADEFMHFWPLLKGVFDGGDLAEGKDEELIRAGSTVVDLSTRGFYKIVRPGSAMEKTVEILEKHNLQPMPDA